MLFLSTESGLEDTFHLDAHVFLRLDAPADPFNFLLQISYYQLLVQEKINTTITLVVIAGEHLGNGVEGGLDL